MATSKKSNGKKYSAKEKRAYYVGVGVGKVGVISVCSLKYRDGLNDNEAKSFNNGMRFGLKTGGKERRLLTAEFKKK